MRILLMLWLGCIGLLTEVNAQKVEVPRSEISGLLITDGRFEAAEWKGATIVPMSTKDSAFLYLKNHKDNILLGIKAPFKLVAYIDMYVDFGEGYIHHFHSSAQIAERILTDTTWTDSNPPTHWGNAKSWYANENRTDRVKAQELVQKDPNRDRTLMLLETTYPFEGYEYVFRKERFAKKEWKVRIEVRTGMPGYKDIIFPAGSVRKNSSGWATIKWKD